VENTLQTEEKLKIVGVLHKKKSCSIQKEFSIKPAK
jgi:hypothetical protein